MAKRKFSLSQNILRKIIPKIEEVRIGDRDTACWSDSHLMTEYVRDSDQSLRRMKRLQVLNLVEKAIDQISSQSWYDFSF